jgi:putative membrane-bound dehydrogenase-like protein
VKPTTLRLVSLGICLALGLLLVRAQDPPRTGPETEKRFPPLKVPTGFKATLFACDPLIQYPSAICAGPRSGALFVAIDYQTGLGDQLERRDEIRLVEDTDGDGYADKATVFAKGFNSIQGLAYHDGTLYVMHAPFLTALRDTKGSGVADERRDLLTGLGLPPEKNPTRLHCANGVVPGHDGWLYLALGDNGIDVPRPEGDRLVYHGGGILRCRPDGRDLHLFATGLRNIYDVALDAELNVFVRDNENDGGTYMIRVCHSFHGADHGYPYHYEERPDEALPPIADLGLGSSAGGVCYLERQFPPEYHGDLFFCEWGRSVVRYQPRRSGSAFSPVKEIEFAAGAANDPYGFKPTDLVVQSDGTLMVSDWADGQRPKRGRGRIYHIAYVGDGQEPPKPKPAPQGNGLDKWLLQLDSESYWQRCDAQAAIERQGAKAIDALMQARPKAGVYARMHAVWILVHHVAASAEKTGLREQSSLIARLLDLARSDADARVRVQAIRAVGDLIEFVLPKHRIDLGPAKAEWAEKLAELAKDQDPRVLLEITIALGRLRWERSPDWLKKTITKPDAALAHAAMQTMRRSGNWPAILRLLDEPDSQPMRPVALRALAEQYETAVVDDLIARLRSEKDAGRRRAYADALTRVYKKPGPWVYWGYSPRFRPTNTVAWERTEHVAEALDRVLADPDRTVRLAVLQRMQREKVPVSVASLARWLADERQPERVAAMLISLRDLPAAPTRPLLHAIVRDRQHSPANRQGALAALAQGLDDKSAPSLLELGQALEDGPVLADALRRLVKFPKVPATGLLTGKVQSADADVRAAAIEALADLGATEGREPLLTLLADKEVRVRRAAAAAAGKLADRRASELVLKLTADPDAEVRRASLGSLHLLRDQRVLPIAVAALNDRQTELAALACLHDLGDSQYIKPVAEAAQRNPSAEVQAAAVRALVKWRTKGPVNPAARKAVDWAVAEIQGSNGVLVRWTIAGPMSVQEAAQAVDKLGPADAEPGMGKDFATGLESRLVLSKEGAADTVWSAYTDVVVSKETAVELLGSSNATFQVWLNGKPLHKRDQARPFQIDSDRFGATLASGSNRLLVQVTATKGPVVFHLRFRRKSGKAEHERLTQAALTRGGNAERGRKLFLDVEKSQCLKCHRLGDQGERIGPELTGVGSRFSRIYIVESILEPSRTIAPSFGTLVVSLKNGKVLSGVKIADTDTTLTLADSQGQKHVLTKTDIDEMQPSPVSTMPEELEKRFTEEEFVDLIAFLVSQKQERGP